MRYPNDTTRHENTHPIPSDLVDILPTGGQPTWTFVTSLSSQARCQPRTLAPRRKITETKTKSARERKIEFYDRISRPRKHRKQGAPEPHPRSPRPPLHGAGRL
ncbi:unnamed protein product [Pleuronectes platessa]|uniref:Uncharacterized protein n=1 Tax=Pleuronectes platessa TaxID=8262 RepID=A0A9N7V7X2_PLEPL|nr:unnamed protein product [Pleuronectes platessa]